MLVRDIIPPKIKKFSFRIIILLLMILFLFQFLFSSVTQAGYWPSDLDFNFRKAINLAGGTVDLTDYQVRLTFQGNNPLQPDYLDFFKIRDNGPDIRFTDTDKTTQIPYWIESWDDVLQTTAIWVKVPNIPTTGKTIYIYYGHQTATSQSDGSNTFLLYDLLLKGYWHMDEPSWNGTPGEVVDYTGINNGTAQGGATTTASGHLNRAGQFDGTNDSVDVPHSASLGIAGQITIDTWIYLSTLQPTNPILRKGSSLKADVNEDGIVNNLDLDLVNAHWFEVTIPPYPRYDINEDGFVDMIDKGNLSGQWNQTNPLWFLQIQKQNYAPADNSKILFSLGGSLRLFSLKTFTCADENQWWHIVATYDSSTMSLYINDVPNGSLSISGSIPTTSVSLRMANDPSERINTNYLNGRLDEVIIYNRALSQTEITTISNNLMEKMGGYYNVRKYVSPEPSFLNLGPEEERLLVMNPRAFLPSSQPPPTPPEEKPITGKTIEEMKREDILRQMYDVLTQLNQLYIQLIQIWKK